MSLTAVLTALILTSSCEKRNNGGKFTVTGQWLKDCTGAARANEPIVIGIEVSESLFSKPVFHEDIGSGVTDDQGRFSIQCENLGSGYVYINARSRYEQSSPIFARGGDGQIDDLGTFYDTYTATANLKFVFRTPLSDTFFVSKNASKATPDFYIYPATGTQVIQITTTGSMKPVRSFNGLYSIGRAELNKPVNSGDPRILELPNAFGICGGGDVTEVVIP